MRLTTLQGWRRNMTAFILGALATLTLAPFFMFPLIIPAFTGLLLLLSGAPTHRRAFWDGWWWGWGFYTTGLYWFCVALLTDPEKFAWLIPFALFGITGVIAIYCGVTCWIASRLALRGCTRIFAFSVVWVCVEYVRGHLFTGFPWNLEGYSFGFSGISLQMASLVGAYGLTWFAVLLGASFAAIGEKRGNIFIASVWGVFVLGLCWGQGRLYEAGPEQYVPGVKLRLVQANNIRPANGDPKLQMAGLREYMRLTRSPGLEHITHVIWPESSIPYILRPGTPLAHALGENIPDGAILISGALRDQGEGDDWQVWNSLMALNHEGSLIGAYDKIRLVPFGEFLPLRWAIPKLWVTPVGEKDFSRGTPIKAIEWPGLPPIYPLICYEAIFPELDIDPGQRPGLLLNITNDAWFGMSIGPYQHFAMARMRAVEQGVPLVRAANTGISATVDGYGRVISYIPLEKQGFLDIFLPKSTYNNTIYGHYNNIFLLFLVFISLILILKQRKILKD